MGEVRVSPANESDAGEYLVERLPTWMPRHSATGNFKLMDTVGRAIDRLDDDIALLDDATTVQHARTIDQLERLAELVDLPPNEGESREHYRSRIMAEFQQLTSEGSPAELINDAATILDVPPEKVEYKKDGHGTVVLTIPGDALDSLNISSTEFVEIVGSLIAASFHLRAIRRGDFTYLSTSDYTGPYDSSNGGYDPQQLSSDSSKGHDGLDSNGDPKDTGGTYAGLIE